MTCRADIERLWPAWMASIGALRAERAIVRSRCDQCGIQLRVDLEALAAHRGAAASLIDALGRCDVVGCCGSTYYLAARTYGRPWTALLRDPALRSALGSDGLEGPGIKEHAGG